MKEKRKMFARGKPGNWLSIIVLSLSGFLSSFFLGEWNIILEIIRGQSIFGLRDLPGIALWHGLLGAAVGLALGLVWAAVGLLRGKPVRVNFVTCFFIFSFLAAWIFFQGFINIYIYAGIANRPALIVNGIFLVFALVLFSLLIRYLRRKKPKINRWLVGYFVLHGLFLVVALISIFLASQTARPLMTLQPMPTATSTPQRNVILIIWDAARADHLSCYGYPRPTTPHLDDLAGRGILFEQAYSPSSHTLESIASILSSTLPVSHQMNDIVSCLPPDLVIMPQVFQALGYNTAAFSFNPYFSPAYGYKKGFDHFSGPGEFSVKINRTIAGHILERATRVPVVGNLLSPLMVLSEKISVVGLGETELDSAEASKITEKTLSWIKNHPHKPFFILAHLEGGHAPYLAPPEFVRKFWPGQELPPDSEWPTMFPRSLGLFLPFITGPAIDAETLEKMIALYDAKISYHDFWLGQLVKYLEKENKLRNTLLVLIADHGEEFYDHRGWGHGHSLHQELIRVPLVMFAEGMLPSGVRIKTPVSLLDLFPTIISLLNINDHINLHYSLEGEDLSSFILKGQEPQRKGPIISELTQGNNKAYSIIEAPWKLILADINEEELTCLFNLQEDPGEEKDLSTIFPEQRNLMLSRLSKNLDLARQKTFHKVRRTLRKSEKEKLRSLGYIN